MILDPKGIDLPIQEMQQLFIDNLWQNVDVSKKQFNHRVYSNVRRDNVIPEIYIGGNEYQEVKFNDNLHVLSWFDVSDTTDSYRLGQVNQSVGVFFAINLDKLYTELTHRAIEESHIEVQKVLLKRASEFEITGITTGKQAYGDFSTENLKAFNMQPWHVFRFDCNVKYSLNC